MKHYTSGTDHIWVVPLPGSSCRSQDVLVLKEPVNDVQDAVPRVLDVAIVTPQVADLTQLSVVYLNTKVSFIKRIWTTKSPRKEATSNRKYNVIHLWSLCLIPWGAGRPDRQANCRSSQ